MMFYNRLCLHPRIKNTLLLVAVFFASWFIGRGMMPNIIYWIGSGSPIIPLVFGFVVIMALFLSVRAVIIAVCNYRKEELVADIVPNNFRELSKLDVHSPVDFCASMQMMFAYKRTPNLGLPSVFLAESKSKAAWSKALELFRSLYGRMPYGANRTAYPSWGYYLMQEAKAALGRDEGQVSVEEMISLLSPDIAERLRLK